VVPSTASAKRALPSGGGFRRILLASEGRPIPDAAIARAVELAQSRGTCVHVLAIARVHGVSLGMPTPGLLPTREEWAAQRTIVASAIERLRALRVEADGHVLGTRNATKRICDEARSKGCEAIVMAADADRSRFVADMMWSQEPQRVYRRSRAPVFLVRDDTPEPARR
jgi:nucleotide-binding universal stress UspA family protein